MPRGVEWMNCWQRVEKKMFFIGFCFVTLICKCNYVVWLWRIEWYKNQWLYLCSRLVKFHVWKFFIVDISWNLWSDVYNIKDEKSKFSSRELLYSYYIFHHIFYYILFTMQRNINKKSNFHRNVFDTITTGDVLKIIPFFLFPRNEFSFPIRFFE